MKKKKIILLIVIILLLTISGFLYYYKVISPKHYREKLFSYQNFDTSLTPDIVTGFKAQFDEAVKFIGENPKDYVGWTIAGNNKKASNDYYGARDLYLEGLKNVKKENTDVLLSNLADLYYHFINDYKQAEIYYLKAMEVKPDNIQNYIELSIMYRVEFKDQEKSLNILKIGLEKNPDNKDLLIQLANTYVKFDMKEEARNIWNELIKMYPDNSEYKEELQNIK